MPHAQPSKKKPVKFLSRADLHARGVNYSVAQLRRLWQTGKFPRPIALSARKLAWIEDEVNDWFAAQMQKDRA